MSDYRRPVDELPVKNEGALSLTDTLIGVDAVAEPAAFQAQLGEIAARLVGPIADDLPNDAGFIDALISRIIGPGPDALVEYGTFTPTLYATSANPSVTYYVQDGSWVRIGKFVHVEMAIGTSSVSGGSGNIRVGQLPFDTESAVVSRSLSASGLPLPGAAWGLYGFGNQTSRGLRIFRPTNNGSMSEMVVGQWPTSSNASFSAVIDYIMHTP